MKKPAAERSRITFRHFHISRSYCISSVPVNGPSRLKVRISDHVFSNMLACRNLTPEAELSRTQDTAEQYRRGYWQDVGRSRWDHTVEPLDRHTETGLTRRQSAQSSCLPQAADQKFSLAPASRCLIEKRQRQSTKAKSRAERRKQLQEDDSSQTSSSSSSSTDSSASS